MRLLGALTATLLAVVGLLLLQGRDGATGPRTEAAPPRIADEPNPEDVLGAAGPLAGAPTALVPPTPRPRPEVVVLRGEVRLRPRDVPMPDIPLRLTPRSGPEQGTVSDEDGRFRFTLTGDPGGKVEALAPRGYVARPAILELTRAHLDGEAELVLHIERGPSAPVRGQVVDEHSGEGVFQVTVKIRQVGGALSDTVVTDDQGFFETTRSYPAGGLRAGVVDEAPEGPAPLGSFRRQHLEGRKVSPPWILEIPVGPTYFLVPSRGGAFATGTLARLVEDRPRTRSASLRVRSGGFELMKNERLPRPPRKQKSRGRKGAPTIEVEDEDGVAWPTLQLRPGPVSWVRYPERLGPKAEGFAARLLVQSPGERGSAQVPALAGRHDNPLLVPLVAVAQVAGRTVLASEEPVPDVQVSFYAVSDVSGVAQAVVQSGADGKFGAAGLPVGAYRVEFAPADRAGLVRAVTLEPGPNRIPGLVFDEAREGGTIEGRLVLPEGPGVSFPPPTLVAVDGSRFTARAELVRGRGRRGDDSEVRFQFHRVPFGRYEVYVGAALAAEASPAHWTPSSLAVTPPARGLTFRPRKLEFEDQVLVRALGPAGELVGKGTLWFEPPGYIVGSTQVDSTLLDARGRPQRASFHLPPEAELNWRFWAQGYRAERGGDHDLVRLEDGRQELLIAAETGWSGVLNLRQPGKANFASLEHRLRDSEPLSGAKVWADGLRQGRSDRDGNVFLDLEDPPARVDIELEGWRVSELVPVSGKLRAGEAHAVLFFRRTEIGRDR